MFTLPRSSVFILALLVWTASALAPNKGHLEPPPKVSDAARTRRSVLTTTVATIATTSASWADTGAEVRGTTVTPFNGLAFQYRGSEFGGLKATDLDEPSVNYQDFVQRLKAGEVKFVEFMAPDGDKAYATFVSADGKTQNPIRIGEGEI